MIEEFSIILSTDLFVSPVTRMKIPVVLDFDMTISPIILQILHHEKYELYVFKIDHNLVEAYQQYSNY